MLGFTAHVAPMSLPMSCSLHSVLLCCLRRHAIAVCVWPCPGCVLGASCNLPATSWALSAICRDVLDAACDVTCVVAPDCTRIFQPSPRHEPETMDTGHPFMKLGDTGIAVYGWSLDLINYRSNSFSYLVPWHSCVMPNLMSLPCGPWQWSSGKMVPSHCVDPTCHLHITLVTKGRGLCSLALKRWHLIHGQTATACRFCWGHDRHSAAVFEPLHFAAPHGQA